MHFSTAREPGVADSAGLSFTVKCGRPGLTLEYAGGRRIRLCEHERPILWARVEDYYAGVWMVRKASAAPVAVLPPIRAHEARSIETTQDWMKFIARGLNKSERSPLRSGVWQLTELRPQKPSLAQSLRAGLHDVFEPADADNLPAPAYGLLGADSAPRACFVDWGINGSGGVWPLRTLSTTDAARVKAWRKHAREGTLPPIVLWWVGAFDMHVIIDGHDRLRAAVVEGVLPRAVTLWQPFVDAIEDPTKWRDELVRNYERAFLSERHLSDGARDHLNRSLVESFRSWHRVQTSATARPTMTAEWISQVQTELSADPDLARRVCGASSERP